jgi:hypothetical protein
MLLCISVCVVLHFYVDGALRCLSQCVVDFLSGLFVAGEAKQQVNDSLDITYQRIRQVCPSPHLTVCPSRCVSVPPSCCVSVPHLAVCLSRILLCVCPPILLCPPPSCCVCPSPSCCVSVPPSCRVFTLL